jgi:protein gp37
VSLNPTGIEWTHVFGEGSGYTWNPITGCTHGCDYCYARALVETRLADIYPNGFAPTFWPERLGDVTPRQKPRGIFVGSMGDMWDPGVPQEWRDRVWARMAECRQHVYFTLTKQPQNFEGHNALGDAYAGITVTRQEQMRIAWEWSWWPNFVSFEPLLGPICLEYWDWMPDWIIIGADSRPAGIAHTTEPAWVEHLAAEAQAAGVPVFAKDNLARVMGAEWVAAHRQWPAGLEALQCPASGTS